MIHFKINIALAAALVIFTQTAFATPADREKPIKGESDTNLIDANTGKTVMTGNVIIVQGELKIFADKVTIETDAVTNKLTYMLAEGNPVRFKDLPAETSSEVEVEGQTIEFFPNKNLIITLGNAQITQDNNQAQGERIEYNTLTGIMTIESERSVTGDETGKRAELIIQPGAVD